MRSSDYCFQETVLCYDFISHINIQGISTHACSGFIIILSFSFCAEFCCVLWYDVVLYCIVLYSMVLYFMLQWNPGLTICQGSVKMISLNRDIVIVKFSVI